MFGFKQLLPRSLFGRAALILVVPIVTIQLVVSTAFIQRHFEGVTRQMTQGVALDLAFVLQQFEGATDQGQALSRAEQVAQPLEIKLIYPVGEDTPLKDTSAVYDLSGRAIIQTLHEALPNLLAADVAGEDRVVHLRFATDFGDLEAEVSRRRMSATNPHQLLVLMVVTSVLMTLLAYVFLRNQLRPITKLAQAAEAFGRGESFNYRPRGAIEVRAAGRAFLDMRQRLERHIEQRMLMLSGVSHDLRTPLTRLKLALSFLPEDEETLAMLSDVAQMERLTDEFLSFVRGDATESEEECDVEALLAAAVSDAQRGGGAVSLMPSLGKPRLVKLRPQAVRRAVDNLVNNGLRHGGKVMVGAVFNDRQIGLLVEDNGPGIPIERREEAMRPFTRLGAERDPNRGGGVGLGLSIAADVAMSHGGTLRLDESMKLGGLKAVLELAR